MQRGSKAGQLMNFGIHEYHEVDLFADSAEFTPSTTPVIGQPHCL